MRKELFGVFGDREAFDGLRASEFFDRVVGGDGVTVGVRDCALGYPGRSSVHAGDGHTCVVWGEAYAPDDSDAAAWLSQAYRDHGRAAFDGLNGSYVAVVDGDPPVVAVDQARTWECFYADTPAGRVFGTDPASVAGALPQSDRAVLDEALTEFVLLGVVLGDRTVLGGVDRVPFDGYLEPSGVGALDRFVYDHREFDYAAELADRLRAAFARRQNLPGESGVLLSAGYDSRTALAGVPDVETCYTVGQPDADEVQVARRIADQYDARHETLVADERYVITDPETTQFGLGVKESLHVHHGGHTDEMGVDSIYHGLLFDTFLRGYFLPLDAVELFGRRLPRQRLEPEPDVAATVASKFGYHPEFADAVPECSRVPEDAMAFVRDAVDRELEQLEDRYDSIHDGTALFGIQNQPTMPFRLHLADNFVESFVAADAGLVDWHLSTPPEHRNDETYREALEQFDADVLRHNPPDRPHSTYRRNQVSKFLHEVVPGLDPYQSPLPNRDELYDRHDYDDELLPGFGSLHGLPPRLKLRLNDARNWLELATEDQSWTPRSVLCR